MIKKYKKIKKIIKRLKNSKIKYSNNGVLVPIYFGFDSDENLIFDVESIRDEFEFFLIELEKNNGKRM
jgi:hypothetical protein